MVKTVKSGIKKAEFSFKMEKKSGLYIWFLFLNRNKTVSKATLSYSYIYRMSTWKNKTQIFIFKLKQQFWKLFGILLLSVNIHRFITQIKK